VDVILFGAIARMVQALVAASPTIVVGWIVAAVMERILGRDGTFKLFGGHTWRQLPYAWLLGMLLPVCSLGVIPIMVQMRKSGIAGGTILAFGLTAPLFNPISVLYGLTLSDPIALFVFCLCSLTIVTVMGLLWDWLFPANWLEPEPLEKTPYGLRRVGAVALSVCQQAASRSTLFILIAIVGVGILSMLLPPGCLQKAAGKNDMTAPLTMAAVATLAYITPMVAIVQIASMFQHGNSIGAAFTLLVLGTGVNLGLMAWIVANYKWKPSLIWLASLLGVVLLLGYAVDRPLQPKGVEPADHTHAFDVYCSPFQPGTADAAQAAVKLVRDSWKAEELIALFAGLVFLTIGLALMRLDPKDTWMKSLTRLDATGAEGDEQQVLSSGLRKDIVLPNWVIALCSFVGLVAASILGCFLYYPPRSVIKDEMIAIHTELMTDAMSFQFEKVQYWIPIQEDWAHKLAVSAYLRGTPLTRFQKMKLQVLMSKMELLEHAAEDSDKEEVTEFRHEYNRAFQRLNKATATAAKPKN
jgi:uncharacterized protein